MSQVIPEQRAQVLMVDQPAVEALRTSGKAEYSQQQKRHCRHQREKKPDDSACHGNPANADQYPAQQVALHMIVGRPPTAIRHA